MSETTDIEVPADALEAAGPGAEQLDHILEALLLASEQAQSLDQLHRLLGDDLNVTKRDLRDALASLAERLGQGATELIEVASGFRVQVRSEYTSWVSKLWQEKPPRLSRAMLETLALICYRQPITRGEIEEVRGVSMSPNIMRNLLERGWIREVGVKEVPGRPTLFGTSQQLLDDLNLKSLDQLPSLPEIKDPQQLDQALERLGEQPAAVTAEKPADDTDATADEEASLAVAEDETPQAVDTAEDDVDADDDDAFVEAGEEDDVEADVPADIDDADEELPPPGGVA